MTISALILAAGQGTRMRSALPKVLHPLAGRPLLHHVHNAAAELTDDIHIVYGHGGSRVVEALSGLNANWIEQREQLGTGHAVMQALPHLKPDGNVLILYGDVPLITTETLKQLLKIAQGGEFALLTVELNQPTGYGRIVRDERGQVLRIVEEKDASDAERAIREINTGIMALPGERLSGWLARLNNHNVQGEYYLTDVIGLAVQDGIAVRTVAPESPYEVMGVNNRAQLAELERYYQLMQAEFLMGEGVTLADPARFDLRGNLEVGQDIFIDINVLIEGEVKIGNNVSIGPHNVLRNVIIGDDVEILPHCDINGAIIGKGARIGPFTRVRPGTEFAEGVHIGNFVEVKKSKVGKSSKINHLSYIGDSEVGCRVNIGAGTITCNYDGANKHLTVIEDDVFVGSDTQLVAPVRIGKGATVGAGTTVTKDVPPGVLAVGRVQQAVKEGWKRPEKKK